MTQRRGERNVECVDMTKMKTLLEITYPLTLHERNDITDFLTDISLFHCLSVSLYRPLLISVIMWINKVFRRRPSSSETAM